jgi:hypothetical protein
LYFPDFVQGAVELAHGPIALIVAQVQYFLKRDADVGQVLFDVSAFIVFDLQGARRPVKPASAP